MSLFGLACLLLFISVAMGPTPFRSVLGLVSVSLLLTACGGDDPFFSPPYFVIEPSSPQLLQAVGETDQGIILTWSDTAEREDRFVIERSVDGGFFSELAQVSAGVLTYTDDSAERGRFYKYRIYAENRSGASGYSNESLVPESPDLPSVELDLTLHGQILLAWVNNATVGNRIQVERRVEGEEAWSIKTSSLSNDAQTFVDSDPSSSVAEYRVRSCSEVDSVRSCSFPSPSISTTSIPSVPTNFSVVCESISGTYWLHLIWKYSGSEVASINEFRIYRGLNGGSLEVKGNSDPASVFDSTNQDYRMFLETTGLPSGSVLTFSVRAFSASRGQSDYSNLSSVICPP